MAKLQIIDIWLFINKKEDSAMKRQAMQKLKSWKTSSLRKPLIIHGARQVGKTWLMREFGKKHFVNTAYINFENNRRMEEVFQGNFDIKRLITALQVESGTQISPETTLIIFDEVQEVPQALTSLKYFNENAPEYAITAAGSLLGIALHEGTSFPVGKVAFMDLYPMTFSEFLDATGNENLNTLLQDNEWDLITAFKSRYIELLKSYFYVGGMPEAVQSFVTQNNYSSVREIQLRLLSAYDQDFSKHAPVSTVPRLRMVWNSIPSQLAKENRKFLYGSLRKGARAKEFELAIQWLHDCGLISQVQRIKKPALPLNAYSGSGFKMFMLDVGLLAAMSGLDEHSIINGNQIFEEFKGALTEQYVQQQLRAETTIEPYYWSKERGNAEVDFIFQYKTNIIPLEVKAAENLQAKSLKSYCETYSPNYAVRTSMSNYRQEKLLTNLPLYAISQITKIISE
jgi:predicted AAA+ superfamily ATPase